jgi:hypothetical protein
VRDKAEADRESAAQVSLYLHQPRHVLLDRGTKYKCCARAFMQPKSAKHAGIKSIFEGLFQIPSCVGEVDGKSQSVWDGCPLVQRTDVLMITTSFGMQGAAGQPVTPICDAHLTPSVPDWMSSEDYVGYDSDIDLSI